MAGIAYDTSELVTTLKDRGLVPTDQSLFSTAAFLRSCTQQMWSDLCVDLLRVRNGYLLWTEEQALVASQANYRIPHRALGGKVEEIVIENSDGSFSMVTQVSRQRIHDMQGAAGATGNPAFFHVENHEIVLFPAPASAGATLQVTYPIRPGRLVETSEAIRVDIITLPGGGVTRFRAYGTVPTGWSSKPPMDIIASKPGFQYLAIGVSPLNVGTGAAGYVEFFTSDLPSQSGAKAVTPIISSPGGDWIALAEESAVPQVPAEMHATLALLGLATHLKGIGDFEQAAVIDEMATRERKSALNLITPRVNGQPKLAVNKSWLSGRRR